MKLYVGGFGLRGDGYPNAERTIALLSQQNDIEIIQCGGWLPETLQLWRLARMPRWRATWSLLGLIARNLLSLIRLLGKIRHAPAPVYVPYPSIFFLGWVSLLPRRWRPFCIVDAYISIWDSLVRDRAGSPARGWQSRVLKSIEARSLKIAALVLVDTQANRELMSEEFGLKTSQVRSLPLAIDESHFVDLEDYVSRAPSYRLRILFVGTLIPLHGVPTLLDAIRELLPDPRFEFRIIGNGQMGGLVKEFESECQAGAITWISEWCSLDQIASEIAAADICLGVFGGENKAARVLPFKVYMYLAAGRAVISQSKLSTPEGVPFPPIEAVQPIDAKGLVEAIRRLANDSSKRERLSAEGRIYYRKWLANSCLSKDWRQLITQLQALVELVSIGEP